jgi:hypothetical protein
MAAYDKVVKDTIEAKNALEGKIYEYREKLESNWVPYTTEAERLLGMLDDKENWLYEDGRDTNKGSYLKNIKELDGLFKGIIDREFQYLGIPPRLQYLNSELIKYDKFADSKVNIYFIFLFMILKDEKFSHITEEER